MTNISEKLVIENPKQINRNHVGRTSLYPYYAGFSQSFANSILSSATLSKNAKVLDLWNGSGTTTTAAIHMGYNTQGYDLNPVMIIAAKACMLNIRGRSSLWPIAVEIMSKASKDNSLTTDEEDPLCTWMVPFSVITVRKLEKALQTLLIDSKQYQPLIIRNNFNFLSDIAAFFYTALFRCVRKSVSVFIASNPTWVKKPKLLSLRVSPDKKIIIDSFGIEVKKMIQAIENKSLSTLNTIGQALIEVASSESLPIDDKSVDFILTSPPYCTRIDYAVATMPELALIGYNLNSDFKSLRKKLIGTSTVSSSHVSPLNSWGETCNKFLEGIANHESKASKTYYYKNHIQYFDSIYKSFSEINRTLNFNGTCVVVVQDSHYKNIHNDLPQIFTEMANSYGLSLKRRDDFNLKKTMADINPRSNKHKKCKLTESVLCFSNN
jgi:DNA modification methylase